MCDVSGRYLFWLASGIQTQLLTHSLQAEHTLNISVSVGGTADKATACELTYPSSVLRVPLQDTARVISSLPLSSERHLAVKDQQTLTQRNPAVSEHQ